MRKRLLVAGAALLLAAAAALGVGFVLRSQAERNWRAALNELEQGLGPDASVTYASLEVALFARGGTVHGLSVSAPGSTRPFALTIGRIDAEGLSLDGAGALNVEASLARDLVLDTEQGRWRSERLLLDGLVVRLGPTEGPEARGRQLSFEQGRVEQIAFDGSIVLPERQASTADPAPAAGRMAMPERAAPTAELARAELAELENGRLGQLRFEALSLTGGEDERLQIARGNLGDLDLVGLVSALRGQEIPEQPLVGRILLEDGRVRDQADELHFASLTAEERAEGGNLWQSLVVEGMTFLGAAPFDERFWSGIEQAGYGRGVRLQFETVLQREVGRIDLRSFLLELPEAVSVELTGELLGVEEAVTAAGPGLLGPAAGGVRLVSAGLTVIDSGGLDTVLTGLARGQGMTGRQLRQVAAFRVAEALRQGQIPRQVGLAVQEFLAGPGRLEITVQPAEPVGLLTVAMLGGAPDEAAERLGITAENKPSD